MDNIEILNPILFGILLVLVLVWFGLCHKLFKFLEARHPEKYEEMGKPGLILNNSLSNNFFFMRFLWKREYRDLNDPNIANLCRFMLLFSIIYLLIFIILIILIVCAALFAQQGTVQSIIEFYQFMPQRDEISTNAYDDMKERIKEEKEEWLATVDRYDDPQGRWADGDAELHKKSPESF